jgi:formate hydrogenlyase subunit 3/multisubunit Na+/H+ antiporter MnhD subunit
MAGFGVLAVATVLMPALIAAGLMMFTPRGAAPAILRLVLPLACVPALALAMWPADRVELPAILLGSRLETGVLQQAMLLLIGLAWGLAGWFAADRVTHQPRRFVVFWLASLSGALLATLAGDLASFYFGYALMTLSAYGLVIHDGSQAALRAGRVYLIMAIIAEGALLAGVLLLASAHGAIGLGDIAATDPSRGDGLAAVLLLLGFSVKIGVAGLHLWLPLAHPVAPVPASAVLSGVIVKAGVLGLARLVPPGALPEGWLPGLLALGLFTSFYGVLVGLAQTRVKTVLAYSTVSQMGLVFMVAVLVLYAPERDALLPVLGLIVLHHGLNKAALFLAAGSAPLAGRWRQALFVIPALSLSGLPLLSGALAKGGLKSAMYSAGPGLPAVWWLSLGSLATACLLWRALSLARTGKGDTPPLVHPAWPALVVLGLLVPWLWSVGHGLAVMPDMAAVVDGYWPLAAAAAAVVAGGFVLRRWPALGLAGRIPEGDILVPLIALLQSVRALGLKARLQLPRRDWPSPAPALEQWIASGERTLGSVSAAGLSLLLVGLVAWLVWT